jgi:Protein of unknown function (DUF2630)
MDDARVHETIEQLVAREERLRDLESRPETFSPEEREELEQLRVRLDRLWDVLRQRRAKREAGLDPDDARARPASTVEDYLQ